MLEYSLQMVIPCLIILLVLLVAEGLWVVCTLGATTAGALVVVLYLLGTGYQHTQIQYGVMLPGVYLHMR
jgi:hypothetical protein